MWKMKGKNGRGGRARGRGGDVDYGGGVIIVRETTESVSLDASTHLYKRLCPSVGRSVGPW